MLNKQFHWKCIIASSASSFWIDTSVDWKVFEDFSFSRRLLAWGTYDCHIEDSMMNALMKNIDVILVSGDCTGYIQTPDVLKQAV